MAKKQRIQDLIGLLNGLYPTELAAGWDNVGLQVGDPQAETARVLVALDPTPEAVEAAHRCGAQALVTHHPLLFKPLKRISLDEYTGRTIWTAITKQIAIISVHTNLDSAAAGLNGWLAEHLGLEQSQPLMRADGHFLKLVVFVPETHVDAVSEALFSGGAGQIGAYDRCSFRTAGTGTFRPGAGTQPFSGAIGQTEQAEELRLETILPKNRLTRCLDKMLKAHPYEEAAYDLIPLDNPIPGAGLGRIGRLPETVTLDSFARQVKTALGCSHLRLVGATEQNVDKVAVCGGSGVEVLSAAAKMGADVLVTGDVKYHDARHAQELGIALIDAGHFATEHLMTSRLANVLQQASQQKSWQIDFLAYTEETDPFRVF